MNNIHSLYLSSENNQSTANRSRLQNNLKSAAINLRQAKEELVKAQETLKAAELKASDAFAVSRYLESENNRKAPFEHQLKYVKEECEKLKSEKVALERTKCSLAMSITEKNAIISQKDISIQALEAQIRKQKSEIAQHQSAINSKESIHQHALNRQACLYRNSLNIQDDLYQEILKDKEDKIALLQSFGNDYMNTLTGCNECITQNWKEYKNMRSHTPMVHSRSDTNLQALGNLHFKQDNKEVIQVLESANRQFLSDIRVYKNMANDSRMLAAKEVIKLEELNKKYERLQRELLDTKRREEEERARVQRRDNSIRTKERELMLLKEKNTTLNNQRINDQQDIVTLRREIQKLTKKPAIAKFFGYLGFSGRGQ
ncbi:hypothetical protein INT47_007953 [Mucor saturninus]|uniref:Uncharacterized protein n=1 Tax=Mucor saturninus TaxID=64648 RepID=A0A8H7QSF2_9FUNG|nr:hypothetical protein INT47_007953 [Mucor saturninus]